MTVQCSIKLTEDQERALSLIREGKRHTLLYGGARSGKSFLVIYVIILRALLYAGSRHLAYRLRQKDAIETLWMITVPAVIAGFNGLEPKLKYNNTREYIVFPNNSELWIAGVDDARSTDAILGKEFSSIYANEASQIPYLTHAKVRTRLAQKIDGCQNREFTDLNPGYKAHWTFKEYILKQDPIKSKPGHVVPIHRPESFVCAQMNPEGNKDNLDSDYLDFLAHTTDSYRERFYLGEYADDDGLLVFPIPETGKYAGNDFEQWAQVVGHANVRFAAGLDLGFDDADGFAIIAYCAKPKIAIPTDLAERMGKRWLIYEYKARRTGLAELAKAVAAGLETTMQRVVALGCSWSCFVYSDTGGGGAKMVYDLRMMHHLPVRPAYKRDKKAAIELLQDEVKGSQFMVPAAGAFDQEAEAIVWTKDPETGEIIREIDDRAFHPDLMDAILYGMRAVWVGGLI